MTQFYVSSIQCKDPLKTSTQGAGCQQLGFRSIAHPALRALESSTGLLTTAVVGRIKQASSHCATVSSNMACRRIRKIDRWFNMDNNVDNHGILLEV